MALGDADLDLDAAFEEVTAASMEGLDLALDDEIELEPSSFDGDDDLELDLSGLDDDDGLELYLDLDLDLDSFDDNEDVASKLATAKACIEAGDNDGAKALLKEIVSEGAYVQIGEANKLLGSIN